MTYLKHLFIIPAILLLNTACKKSDAQKAVFTQKIVSLPTHKLSAWVAAKNTKYLVVFESGLGDDHTAWPEKNLTATIAAQSDVLNYDRAGYGKSTSGPAPRNIAKLCEELEKVIGEFAGDRKVVLVGHSLGGMIIRDYAVKNLSKTAALLFVDPSNETYNRPTAEEQEMIYNLFAGQYGANFGGSQEAKYLIDDANYVAALPALPNVPVVVLTSMKTDADHNAADRKKWFDSHELLGKGLSDFKHLSTTRSGHYIMQEESELVLNNLKELLAKLP
ncbi:alpha/beta hydrolase [Mucilaginibacter conchicola]|uniref:Alpha/beta hydrolase n=1 Tax=Mucilaginibacter conchicola TaxID=2303333 RepID=A0A372NWW2_9SPHI|nr:alpha/beta hydrolase [Mucilaginibacter conchicola]RFZ94027.1 alpha/beta hydrolase [Mucilaginibacter conchicola]